MNAHTPIPPDPIPEMRTLYPAREVNFAPEVRSEVKRAISSVRDIGLHLEASTACDDNYLSMYAANHLPMALERAEMLVAVIKRAMGHARKLPVPDFTREMVLAEGRVF